MKLILFLFFPLLSATSFGAVISPNLTASFNKRTKMVDLKWQNTDERVSRFILQRSEDNHFWKDIYVLESRDFKKKKLEKFSDADAGNAKNYYRLKIYYTTNAVEYTSIIMVIVGALENNWTMFPVPVGNILNLQYNGSEPLRGVVSVFIQNVNGYVLTRKRYSSLNRIIQVPVDNLGRGIYDVRIVINEEVIWNQRFTK